MSIVGYNGGYISGNGFIKYTTNSGGGNTVTVLNGSFASRVINVGYYGYAGNQAGISAQTIDNWYCYTPNTSSYNVILYNNSLNTEKFIFPNTYANIVAFQFYNSTGILYISQDITFTQAGIYALSFYAAGRNTYYDTIQKLSAFIDSTQVITDWTATANGVATLLSASFTVTAAGTHTLKIQSTAASNTGDSSIGVTGINITPIVKPS